MRDSDSDDEAPQQELRVQATTVPARRGEKHPWEPDFELAPAVAHRLIRAQFPELGDGGLHLLGAGWDNTAYLFADRWVFRFPRREIAARLIAVESEVLRLVAGRLPLRVPTPLRVGRPADGYPYPFLGYRLVPGRTACSLELDDDARREAAPTLGAFLAELHATRPPLDVNRRVSPVVLSKTDLPGRAADALRRVGDLERGDADLDGGRLRSELTRLSQTPPWRGKPTLLHGDFYACHLLFDDDLAVTGILDWGDTHAGDPALDLSIAYSFLPPDARPALIDAYGAVDAQTLARARFRALCYGVLLTHFAAHTTAAGFAAAGRYALAAAMVA